MLSQSLSVSSSASRPTAAAAAVGGSYQMRLAEHTLKDQCVLSQPSLALMCHILYRGKVTLLHTEVTCAFPSDNFLPHFLVGVVVLASSLQNTIFAF